MEKIHLGLLSSNSQESKSRTAAWEMGQMALARKRRRIAKGVSPAIGRRRCIRCADMCKSAPHRYASRLYAKQNKRASFLGVPVAFLQQLAVCGRCTVCEAFAKAWWKFFGTLLIIHVLEAFPR